MGRPVVTFETARQLAREFGAKDSPDAIRVKGQLVAWIPPGKVKDIEPGTMAVRVPIDQRDAMIADAPEIYYLTPHYLKYPTVLVRLPRIPLDALHDLLRSAVVG